jgi:four helix bundle protein
MIREVSDIEAFSRSKRLYPQVVKLAASFPSFAFHLRDQLCRSTNAIHSDIAEGFGRSTAEFKMYLTRALGSCNEIKSHLDDSINIGVIKKETGQTLIAEYTVVSKQIYRLRENWQTPKN